MKQDLRVIGAVALTSFIIVYICTIVLDKTYSYKLETNQNIKTSNKIEKVKEREIENDNLEETNEKTELKEKNQNIETKEEINNTKIEQENEIIQEPVKQENNSVIEEISNEALSLGQQIVNFAIQYVGYPYVMGGNSLTNGTDCSGFVKLVYEHFGISLSRTPSGQSIEGNSVSLDNRMPGDIVTYGYSGTATHSALYIGEDKVVHAATPSQGIIYGNLYMMPIISIRRVI